MSEKELANLAVQSELNQLDTEITEATLALSQTPDDHPNKPDLLARLGASHTNRFNLLEETNDIEKAIKYTTSRLALIAKDDPDYPGLLAKLGMRFGKRFQHLDHLEDCDQAIKYISLALTSVPNGHPHLSDMLSNQGTLYSIRFSRLSELDDLSKALEYGTRAIESARDDDPHLPIRLSNIGESLRIRYERLGELGDLEKAIEYQSRALRLTPDGHLDLPSRLGKLGSTLSVRFERLNELDDLEKAIGYETRAVALTPDGHPLLSRRLANLATSLSNRFHYLGELEDLERAIDYESQALELMPDGHPNLSMRIANIGVSLSTRYERLGNPGDLDDAIGYNFRALALTPDGHSELSTRLTNLAVSLRKRFERLGELSDLNNAIEHESRALALTPDDHPDLSTRLAHLGACHKSLFQRLGELSALDKAVDYWSRALALTPDDHPEFSSRLDSLAVSLIIRFKRLGELHDLDKAISYGSQALATTPENHRYLSGRLTNLAVSLKHRFRRLGELDDLEKAIGYESRALALTPHDHPDMPIALANLAMSLTHRFSHLEKIDDLNEAIKYQFRALALTPNDHPDLPDRFYNLGLFHNRRFGHLNEQVDLEKAIEYTSRAIELTPGGHPSLPDRHFPFAACRVRQYLTSGDPAQLQDSLASFRIASQSLAGSPRQKFKHAMGWARIASVGNSRPLDYIEAYQTAIDLIPQFIWLGSTTSQRYQDLKETQSLASRAAYAAIRNSQHTLALEWLEHTRCVVWNQSLFLRSPLDQLHSSDPALATRLQTTAARLHNAGSEPRGHQDHSSAFLSAEHVAQEHRQIAQEYSSLLAQARALPGFEDFLKPVKSNSLIRAARNGPIVIINCHEVCCDALVIMPGSNNVEHIHLPDFSEKKAQITRLEMEKSVRNSQPFERGVKPLMVLEKRVEFESILASLWYDIIKPIIDYLGYTTQIYESLPHITWCPTGALSFLPLHAAGDYSPPKSRIFDYVISSYTPTLTALLSSTPSSLHRGLRVLAIGQSNTPGHGRLPGTTQELELLRNHTSNRVEYSQLIDDQATTTAVLVAMGHHDWVHLACHAHQNVGDPTKSGFFLHDGCLDLTSINRRSFNNKGLAYLSACQTAAGDQNLPDEAIHLASGMLMAGYSSVIATMWSVVDDDAPFVAGNVYAQLMSSGKLGNGEAGKALYHAVAELREKVGERNFGRWVPFIHIGS